MPYAPKTHKPPRADCPEHVPACMQGRGDARYGTARWKRKRTAWRRAHPLCAVCLARGRSVSAYAVDHVTPHKGDDKEFWAGGLQSLCQTCHNRKTRIENRQGRA